MSEEDKKKEPLKEKEVLDGCATWGCLPFSFSAIFLGYITMEFFIT